MDYNQVFVDTSMFFALVNEKDQFHESALSIWQNLEKIGVVLITSNYILDETFTLIRLRRGLETVDQFRQRLPNQYEVKIARVTVSDEAQAWDFFLNDWKKLSFTDCVSFALMKRLKIVRAAAFDKHFKKAGFVIESL